MLPVNLPSFAFHMLCPAATLPPPSSPLPICPSVSHRAAISACLIHNLRGRSEHSVCSMKHGERRAALRPLHSSAQSERTPPPSSFLLPAALSTCEREPSESCSFNFHEIIICFVIRASLAGCEGRGRGRGEQAKAGVEAGAVGRERSKRSN